MIAEMLPTLYPYRGMRSTLFMDCIDKGQRLGKQFIGGHLPRSVTFGVFTCWGRFILCKDRDGAQQADQY